MRSSFQMAGSTGENAAAEDAAEAIAEGLRHTQMGVERLEVRERVRGAKDSASNPSVMPRLYHLPISFWCGSLGHEL